MAKKKRATTASADDTAVTKKAKKETAPPSQKRKSKAQLLREEEEAEEDKAIAAFSAVVVKTVLEKGPNKKLSASAPPLFVDNQLDSKKVGSRALWNAVDRDDLPRVKTILRRFRMLKTSDHTKASPEQFAAVNFTANEDEEARVLESRGLYWVPTLACPTSPCDTNRDALVHSILRGYFDIAKELLRVYGTAVSGKQQKQVNQHYPMRITLEPSALVSEGLSHAGLAFLLQSETSASFFSDQTEIDSLVEEMVHAALVLGDRNLLRRLLRLRLHDSLQLPEDVDYVTPSRTLSSTVGSFDLAALDDNKGKGAKPKTKEKQTQEEEEEDDEEELELAEAWAKLKPALEAASKVKQGLQPLHLAALEATDVFKLKKDHTLDEETVNAPALGYLTPLILSALNPNPNVFTTFIDAGGDVTIETDNGVNLLDVAAVCADGTTEATDKYSSTSSSSLPLFADVIKPSPSLSFFFEDPSEELEGLLERGSLSNKRRRMVVAAINAGRLHNVTYLMYNFDSKTAAKFYQFNSETLVLDVAVACGDLRFARLLLLHENFLKVITSDTSTISGNHWLESAIGRGDLQLVRALLDGQLRISDTVADDIRGDRTSSKQQKKGKKAKVEEDEEAPPVLEEEKEVVDECLIIKPEQQHIIKAIQADAFGIAKLLVETKTIPLNVPAAEIARPILHVAVELDSIDFVKFLLKHGASPRGISSDNQTAFLYGLEMGSLACCSVLLEAGVTMDPKKEAQIVLKEQEEMQKQKGTDGDDDDDEDVESPFEGWHIVLTGVFSTSKAIIHRIVEANGGHVQAGVNGKTTHCCYSGRDGISDYGLKMGKGDKKYRESKKKKLPFIDESTILRYLNATNQKLSLKNAASGGGGGGAQANAQPTTTDKHTLPPLHYVVTTSQGGMCGNRTLASVAKYLLGKGADALAVDPQGRSSLALALEVFQEGHAECVNAFNVLLHACGPKHVNEFDKMGYNALLKAAATSKWSFVETFLDLEEPVDINVFVKDAELLTKAEVKRRRTANIAIARNSHTGWSFLHFLAVHNQSKLFFKAVAISAKTPWLAADLNGVMGTEDKTPLLLASIRSFEICKFLLSNPDVDINAVNSKGQNILHVLFSGVTVGVRTISIPFADDNDNDKDNMDTDMDATTNDDAAGEDDENKDTEEPPPSSPVVIAGGGVGFQGNANNNRNNYNRNYYSQQQSSSDTGEVAIQSLINFERWLPKNKKLDYTCKDVDGRSVLHACVDVVVGTSCVSLLLERAPDLLEGANTLGNVPLTSALLAQHTHVATYLLQKGSNPNHSVFVKKIEGQEEQQQQQRQRFGTFGQPAQPVVAAKDVKYIIEKQSCYEFAIKKSYVGVLFAMFQHPKCDLQAALMSSISAGGLAWTEQLLLSLDVVDPEFNARLIQLLFKCTKSPDEASWKKLVTLVRRLVPVSAKAPSVDEETGNSVLHWFIVNHFKVSWFKELLELFPHEETVMALLRCKNKEGQTVLHLAVQLHKKFAVTEILDQNTSNEKRKADVLYLLDETDNDMNTPLHLALAAGDEGVSINTHTTAMLIKHGASVLITNNEGLSVAKILGFLPANQYERFTKALPVGALDGADVLKIMTKSRNQVAAEEEKSAKKRKAAQTQYKALHKKLQQRLGKLEQKRAEAVAQEDERQKALALEGRLNVPVDTTARDHNAYNVYIDAENGTIYDAMLQASDAGASMYGSNKFHHVQLTVINEDNERLRVKKAAQAASGRGGTSFYDFGLGLAKFRVTERWGRTGEYGAKTRERGFQNLKPALKSFDEIFLQKTKSAIGPEFQIRPTAQYLWVKKVYVEKKVVLNAEEQKLEQQVLDNAMPREASTFLRLITDLSEVRRELGSLGVDVETMSLGETLSRSMLVRAYEILKKMDALLSIQDKLSVLRGHLFKEQRSATTTVQRHLAKLTNQLYSTIPRSFGSVDSYNLRHMNVISDKASLKKEAAFLRSLEDVEETLQLVLGGIETQASLVDRLTGMRDLLGINIRPVVQGSSKYDLIEKYCRASASSSIKIHGVARVTRYEDAIRFAPYEGDRRKTDARGLPKNRLLFHSTKVSNCVGILARGLCIAPPEAPTTGWMLGKGIYFADTFQKSAAYAQSRGGYGGYSTTTSTTLERLKVMFLCEVALGESCPDPFSYDVEELPPDGYDSVFAIGKQVPDPAGDFVTKKGVGLHLGSLKQSESSHTLSLSEYVVYDPSRVKIKFVVMYE
eukprot:m.72817 g.72817  ORF g.72817 m.72817 type:complete len:2223 (-) comp24486_c1_seq1:136-6804(-)